MIKNLLLDLGGVIMDIDRQRCVRAYERLGMKHPDGLLGDYVQKGPFKMIEEGSITAAEFRDLLRRELPGDVSDERIDEAFEQFLVGIPPHRLKALRALREHYRIYLLSNTNPIMWHGKIARDFTQEGLTIDDYFDGIVTSFEAKSMKPDEKIFAHAVAKFGIDPAETMFFDDSQANLDAAARLGFYIALVPPGSEFVDIIKRYAPER